MGGNALKNTKTERVDADRYHRLCDEINLNPILTLRGFVTTVIPAYRNKKDFGDMDVLVCGPMQILIETIKEAFSPNEIVSNGDCVSFDYKGVQIDFIKTTQEKLGFNVAYFSYNDLGNFMGRTAHRLGFKYGHDGLWYTLRDDEHETHLVKEILVTDTRVSAFEFLGYDFFRWCDGFDELEDIFEFAASSEYFDPKQFLLVNRSYAGRVRDKKRDSYKRMLEWIKGRWPDLKEDEVPEPINKQEHLLRAFKQFKGFQQAYESAVEAHEQKKRLHEKLNGKFVSYCFRVPPQGKELGIIMKQLREKIEKYNLAQLIIDSDSAQCYNLFYNVLLLNDEYRNNDVLQTVQIKQVSS